MTCILGLEFENKVFIGADSAAVDISSTEPCDIDKVFYINDIIIGGCGSFRNIQIVNYFFVPPIKKKNITSDIEYLVKQFVPSFSNCLKKHNCVSFSEEDTGTIAGQFLISYNNKLYRIDPDLHINRSKSGIDSIGSGELLAKGALTALVKHNSFNYSPKRLILESLKIVSQINPTILPPYKILHTN